MTCFRELSFQKGKLFQMPIRELAQLVKLNTSGKEKRDRVPLSQLNVWKWTLFHLASKT